MEKNAGWQWEINADQRWFHLNVKEIIQYKELILRFVRRDLLANYQQTLLGPLWVFLQPLLTTFVYFIIFSRVANISTRPIPPILFYLPGIIIWTFYFDCLSSTMYTFVHNAYIFSKVYFPRLIVPLSYVLFHTIRLSIQLLLFVAVYLLFALGGKKVHPNLDLLLIPVFIFITACFSLGCGLLVSVFTAKYRDLENVMQFMLRLFMFAAPVVYPASMIPEKFRLLFWLNPLTPVIESFRSAFFSHQPLPVFYLAVSLISSLILMILGIVLFNRREKQIMDVI
ncbi:MAG TPA: ABC transporter permease [Puia sp.]|nr:ABC transporter permease [Puia sp.]